MRASVIFPSRLLRFVPLTFFRPKSSGCGGRRPSRGTPLLSESG